jgi:8-oxo-dGTP pyrophosphatase MutT (NUDIX family)
MGPSHTCCNSVAPITPCAAHGNRSWAPSSPASLPPRAAVRELREETGLCATQTTVELYQLDGVHPFYMASREAIYLCPCFFVVVDAGWSPVLNAEHDDWRWVPLAQAASVTVWPGQRASVTELIEVLGGPPEALGPLRIDIDSLG